MSEPIFPADHRRMCIKHEDLDCQLCFTPTDPLHGDQVDQRFADLERVLEAAEKRRADLVSKNSKLFDLGGRLEGERQQAVARAEKAEAELAQARRWEPAYVPFHVREGIKAGTMGPEDWVKQGEAFLSEVIEARHKAESALQIIDGLLAKFEANYVVDGEGLIERARAAAHEVIGG